MAKVRYITQGINESDNHKLEIEKMFQSKNIDGGIISTAYLRASGVKQIEHHLCSLKNKITVLVGIRNGATSYQGLKRLLDTNVNVYTVDTGSGNGIFHTKNYFVYNEKHAISISGSANFTLSGLIRNIESSTIVELDLKCNDDLEYANKIKSDSLKLMKDYPENVLEITNYSQLDELLDQGLISDEEKEVVLKEKSKNLEKENKKIVPRMKLKIPSNHQSNKKNTLEKVTNKIKKVMLNKSEIEVFKIWRSGELTERDLNIPKSKGTNLTGSMLLKKGNTDIDNQTYFRHQAFKNLKWEILKLNKPYFEYTVVKFHFLIEGINYGIYELSIKHDTRTDTKTYLQKQPMTHLMWGDVKDLVKNRNLLGKEASIYSIKGKDDEYIFSIVDPE